jgi:hypothetical protein
MERDWTASFSIRFRNGTCIIILDKKYNITNSSCHFGSYGVWLYGDESAFFYFAGGKGIIVGRGPNCVT